MGNRLHRRDRTGWRAALDPGLWRRGLAAGTAGAVSMAVLGCALALARDTAGHDWYAAARITVADVLLGVGFDGETPVAYRNADGAVETLSRSGLTHRFEARWARLDILESAWEGATLGALCGLGGALLCLVLVWRPEEERRVRRPAYEPAPVERPEARERFAPPARPVAAPASLPVAASPPAAAAPVRVPESAPPRPAHPAPAIARQDLPDTGGDDKSAPSGGGDDEGDYGRWV